VAVRARGGDGLPRICDAMSRIRYLVSYDICDPKRLRQVARTLEGFGVRLQYSVFECPLDGLKLANLKAELQDLLNHDEDQVLFVSLGPSASDASLVIEAMGLPYELRSRVTVI
jgi:CRISPR-associated protein Cas2